MQRRGKDLQKLFKADKVLELQVEFPLLLWAKWSYDLLASR